MPGGWTRVSEDLVSHFVRRRGRLNSRKSLRGFLWVCGCSQVLGLVVFPVLPKPECQLAGLAAPRTSDLAFLERRRGRMNSRGICGEVTLDPWDFQFLGLVDFPVFPWPECQLAGLAFPCDSIRNYLSDGEAGITPLRSMFWRALLLNLWISTNSGFALF